MMEAMFVLGIDTCGPTGSVALGRLAGAQVEVLGQTALAGRSYSATLVKAVAELLERQGIAPRQVGALVVVSGPGSFTGVRVGLSAVKGLAEAAGLPVVAVSRLAVLATKAGTASATLDAHRHEVFLRLGATGCEARELLAGPAELAEMNPVDGPIAVCDEGAAELLTKIWPGAELKQTAAPTAADALRMAAGRVQTKAFDDVALLDGHYLRRSDAEIFGEAAVAGSDRALCRT